jgi:hypothetical protein
MSLARDPIRVACALAAPSTTTEEVTMTSYYVRFSGAVRLHGRLAATRVANELRRRASVRRKHLDTGDEDAANAVGVSFDWSIEESVLYIEDDDGTGNPEHVTALLRQLMKRGYVRGPVTMYWSASCSRPEPDGFAGGALVVTRTRIYTVDELAGKTVRESVRQARRRRTRARPRSS